MTDQARRALELTTEDAFIAIRALMLRAHALEQEAADLRALVKRLRDLDPEGEVS